MYTRTNITACVVTSIIRFIVTDIDLSCTYVDKLKIHKSGFHMRELTIAHMMRLTLYYTKLENILTKVV